MTLKITTDLGSSIPSSTPHAVSVSLPTWQDNLDYELGLDRVIKSLTTGYPRFFIHLDIRKLAEVCRSAHALRPEEQCMLFPSDRAASLCRAFVIEHGPPNRKSCRIVRFEAHSDDRPSEERQSIYVLFLADEQMFKLAKSFWQHTGLGISSRFAERCLRLLGSGPNREPISPSLISPLRRYSANKQSTLSSLLTRPKIETDEATSTYVEERYGRNMPITQSMDAKLTLRRRIAGMLQENPSLPPTVKKSDRGNGELTEDDVYLYPSGMSSIFFSHQLSMLLKTHENQPIGKSICFGFPYTDTLKIIEKWGPGAHFFGHGETCDLDSLENLLRQNQKSNLSISALFCEFPSNPLLKSPDLIRIRELADQFDFLVIIDETIGNFLNVEVLPYSDMLVSSLTKIFSGDSNVMGGSLVLNPSSKHYQTLKFLLNGTNSSKGLYEDIYFGEDAIYMERNSRDFRNRVKIINENSNKLCDYLIQLNLRTPKIIKKIYYPKLITTENYEKFKRKEEGGYGGVLSIIFENLNIAKRFYDDLDIFKGPSLGTNFTLGSPYVILAHFNELEWASQFDVCSDLIRISIGLEDCNDLLNRFQFAFDNCIPLIENSN